MSKYYMGHCDECGCVRKEGNLIGDTDSGLFRCQSCHDELKCTCNGCGKDDVEMYGTEDGYYFCPECVNYLSPNLPRTNREFWENRAASWLETEKAIMSDLETKEDIMSDLRAEYKRKLRAAEEQQNVFLEVKCSRCGIMDFNGHRNERNYCRYFIFSDVMLNSSPLSLTVVDAGCQLINSKAPLDRSGELTEYPGVLPLTYCFLDEICESTNLNREMLVESLNAGELDLAQLATILEWLNGVAVYTQSRRSGFICIESWKDSALVGTPE